MLALARALAGEQRGGDGLCCGHAGKLIGQYRADETGAHIVGTALDRREAGGRLDDRIVDPLVRVGPGLAEAIDRDVDDPWVYGPDVGLADPQSLDHARPEILDEDVGMRGKADHRVAPARIPSD